MFNLKDTDKQEEKIEELEEKIKNLKEEARDYQSYIERKDLEIGNANRRIREEGEKLDTHKLLFQAEAKEKMKDEHSEALEAERKARRSAEQDKYRAQGEASDAHKKLIDKETEFKELDTLRHTEVGGLKFQIAGMKEQAESYEKKIITLIEEFAKGRDLNSIKIECSKKDD